MAPTQHASLWQRYARFRRLDDRDQLIVLHQYLLNRVRPNRSSRTPSWYDEDDLRQAAAIGLAEAVERYDPTSAASFETFAAPRIHGAALDDLRQTVDWAPRRTRQRLNAIAHARQEWAHRHPTIEPSAADLAALADMSPETVRDLLTLEAHASAPVSIDEAADVLPLAPDPLEGPGGHELRACVRALPEPGKTVLVLHYFEDLAMTDVAQAMGISRVTAHKHRAAAVDQVRNALSR